MINQKQVYPAQHTCNSNSFKFTELFQNSHQPPPADAALDEYLQSLPLLERIKYAWATLVNPVDI